MKTRRPPTHYKLYGIIVLAVVVFILVKINTLLFFQTLTRNSLLVMLPILLILYVASLPLSYAIQFDMKEAGSGVGMAAVIGFASGIALAALMVFFWMNMITNGLLFG